tara:strand:+ start:6561 stop:7436 length:876 start_codon:yes stop_codon:yes gene_type:complete
MGKHINLDRPLIVVGAGRSGTTLIRDALMQHKDVASFEFEMNALWKYGNEHIDHDMLCVNRHYSDVVSNYIRNVFERKGVEFGRPRLLDKTVANVMRLAYVQEVLPEARILHVIRDGRSVTSSAMARWSAKHPSAYFIKKLKTVPLRSLPWFAFYVIKSKYLTLVQGKVHRQTWGARWPGFDRDATELPLAAICAKQWTLQVEAALEQKTMLKPNTYMEIRYEELVSNPQKVFDEVRCFFQLDYDEKFNSWINSAVDDSRTDKWHKNLNKEQLGLVLEQSSHLLKSLGYLE